MSISEKLDLTYSSKLSRVIFLKLEIMETHMGTQTVSVKVQFIYCTFRSYASNT